MSEVATTLCFRCHYNLHGVADDQACPECGLLAGRSRRVTDALRDARPKWLRSLSIGVWLILFAFAIAGLWLFIGSWLAEVLDGVVRSYTMGPFGYSYRTYRNLQMAIRVAGEPVAAVILLLSAFLFTRREGYDPADRADRLRRRWIRIFAWAPLLAWIWLGAMATGQIPTYDDDNEQLWIQQAFVPAVLTLALMPLPVLGFAQFKSLARRAGSRHLMEHCSIVGAGVTSTLAVLYVIYLLFTFAQTWGMGTNWASRSTASLLLMLLAVTSIVLFWMWCVYLMIRFAISFGRASRESRRAWVAADRSNA